MGIGEKIYGRGLIFKIYWQILLAYFRNQLLSVGLVDETPESPTHTGLDCIKTLEPNISCLALFKESRIKAKVTKPCEN